MLSLMLRFYDPQTGVIELDGRDLRTITQRSLREHIGIVTQETFLFHDTIYENIRYGRLDATEAEIQAAAKLAYAHDFILAQPEGYDTMSEIRAACFRAVNSSDWRLRGRCSRTRRYCCWTRRPRLLIRNQSA
jgi:ABC-type transport system involved in Fe-S cluster assembly fused permease/ATPase subunit